MHPIERLRYVARASGADASLLVQESASALAALRDDPQGIVTACRRLVARHPLSGPVWWLSTRVLTAIEPLREAWECADEIEADPTPVELAHALPDEAMITVVGWPATVAEALARRGDLEVLVVDVADEGTGLVRALRRADVEAELVPAAGLGAAVAASDLVLVEASIVGAESFVAVTGSRAAASVGWTASVPVWLVAGVGRFVPDPLVVAALASVEPDDPWRADDEVVPLGLVGAVCSSSGVVDVADAVATGAAVPMAAELLRPPAF